LEDRRSKNDEVSGRMWKAIETKVEKIWIAEEKEKEKKENKENKERKEEEEKEKQDDGYK